MGSDTFTFEASDKKRIFVRRVLPEGKAAAVILIAHGMVEHGARYLDLAAKLSSLGFAVYIPDLRGHGETDRDGNWGFLAESGGFRRVVEDLRELGAAARKANGRAPLCYLGHSFGALLGLAFMALHGADLAGCVLSAPPSKPGTLMNLGGKLIIETGTLFKGARAAGNLPKAMTFGAYARSVKGATTPCDWISRDTAVVAAYMADPACSFTCSYSFYRDAYDGTKLVYAPGFLDKVPTSLPLYFFCGSEDPVVGKEKGFSEQKTRLASLGLSDFTARSYPGGRHETLNETNRDEVIADLCAWFQTRLPGRTASAAKKDGRPGKSPK
jgi:alpha-beta hydrolase superfamily lysophospholipase